MSETNTLLVVGDGPVADVLVPLAGLLGWECRAATELPEALAGLSDADAVVVTSHHAEVDGPAIRAALAADTPYIGAMGSRRTQDRRREWLLGNGVAEGDLVRVHGPAGLAIGADPPPEIALSILAEAVAVLRGVDASGSLKDTTGPLHPDLPPGTATCPTG
jgi:xanthine/CO dehydrogenase XdhC/CoxF family maturation factor